MQFIKKNNFREIEKENLCKIEAINYKANSRIVLILNSLN